MGVFYNNFQWNLLTGLLDSWKYSFIFWCKFVPFCVNTPESRNFRTEIYKKPPTSHWNKICWTIYGLHVKIYVWPYVDQASVQKNMAESRNYWTTLLISVRVSRMKIIERKLMECMEKSIYGLCKPSFIVDTCGWKSEFSDNFQWEFCMLNFQ
jgi:hypothetical protein